MCGTRVLMVPLLLACRTSSLALLKGTLRLLGFVFVRTFMPPAWLCFFNGGVLPEASPLFSVCP